VRVLASGVEYTEVVIRRHLNPQTMMLRPPFVMGYYVVGEIDQLCESVSGFYVGDRVADIRVVGSNALPHSPCRPVGQRAAGRRSGGSAPVLILSWTVAHQLLRRTARVQQGQRMLPPIHHPSHADCGPIPIEPAAPPLPTKRDFVPWRFSDACRRRTWMATSCRRPRNLHSNLHSCRHLANLP
ncbi:MAG TPA: alcohol dehydrogenase catalytic domain-containing protein, partial [Rhizomicrobium sp.]